jgi:iron(III) transport system ATP-binding protein
MRQPQSPSPLPPSAPGDTAALRITDLTRYYGSTAAIDGVNVEVGPGQLVSLLGPSGCGKTTTLRLVAGFSPPDRGRIEIGGRTVADAERGLSLPPEQRDIGMVFQSYALWPHMTVAQNIGFPLDVRGRPSHEIEKRVSDVLELVQLGGLGQRYPHQLSGGQQQRVALARALAHPPHLLLLDEPLSNLDARLREEVRGEVRALQRRLDVSCLFVTHDQAEALAISDMVVVMRDGRVQQAAAPDVLYEAPSTAFVASFLGTANILDARPGHGGLSVGPFLLPPAPTSCPAAGGPSTSIVVRPEDVHLLDGAFPDAPEGRIVSATFLGGEMRYELVASDLRLIARAAPRPRYAVGDAVRVQITRWHSLSETGKSEEFTSP